MVSKIWASFLLGRRVEKEASPPLLSAKLISVKTLLLSLTQKALGTVLSLSPACAEAGVSETSDLYSDGGRPGRISHLLSAHSPRPLSAGVFVSSPVALRMLEEPLEGGQSPGAWTLPPPRPPPGPLCATGGHVQQELGVELGPGGQGTAGPVGGVGATGEGTYQQAALLRPQEALLHSGNDRGNDRTWGGVPASASRAQPLPSAVSHLLPPQALLPLPSPPWKVQSWG